MERQGRTEHQSRELEALLAKLNGVPEGQTARKGSRSFLQEPLSDEEMLAEDESFASMDLSIDLSNSEGFQPSLDDSFFLVDEDEDEGLDESEELPRASGSFARAPSGGFMLLFESFKLRCAHWGSQVQAKWDRLRSKKVTGSRRSQTGAFVSWKSNRRRRWLLLGGLSLALMFLLIFALRGGETPEPSTPTLQFAAQPKAAPAEPLLDENFDELAEMNFDVEDFSIPSLEGAPAQAKPLAAKEESKPKVEASAEAKVASNEKSEPSAARRYGRQDNVLAEAPSPKTVKLSRDCVMREGPSSRFALISQLKRGQSIQVLANTDEDWVLESSGQWSKSGQTRLGPGTHFAVAKRGMTVPTASSRVISSKNWRYVQVAKVFGYVGPACFK